MRDRRSYKIKNILKQHFPRATFRVRIEKYSLGETIHIYTDLLKEPDWQRFRMLSSKLKSEGLTSEEYSEYREIVNLMERNRKLEAEIKNLLKDFWHVFYDDFSGEILSGGNTFLFVYPEVSEIEGILEVLEVI